MNAIKDSIKSGRTVVGTTAGPNVDVSILAEAGYDFVLFDTQHSPSEIKQLQPSIQTMRGKPAAPLVRVAANQAYQICFALDAGARGIVVPMVNTGEEAQAAELLGGFDGAGPIGFRGHIVSDEGRSRPKLDS